MVVRANAVVVDACAGVVDVVVVVGVVGSGGSKEEEMGLLASTSTNSPGFATLGTARPTLPSFATTKPLSR